ncbi:tegument protein US11 [Chimpanzee herpesvirus strain 105640]|uniref:Tegument protein US11 n=1 Tax=Chimpanzee herpesvirus strain 105640 TaxID=332937 RepID=K9MEY2_9ALPH|nr:tegument protein US11 [Chimpanzee herpesvirus strain 105640]AFV26961.1 tegument protein US11 [Chimpanzee herpesvirus strain 105640]
MASGVSPAHAPTPVGAGSRDLSLKGTPSNGMQPRGADTLEGHSLPTDGPPHRGGDHDPAAGKCGDSGVLRVCAALSIPKPPEAVRQSRIPRASRVPREPRVPRSPREPRVPRTPRDPRPPRVPREPRPPRAPREPRAARGLA